MRWVAQGPVGYAVILDKTELNCKLHYNTYKTRLNLTVTHATILTIQDCT